MRKRIRDDVISATTYIGTLLSASFIRKLTETEFKQGISQLSRIECAINYTLSLRDFRVWRWIKRFFTRRVW